MHAHRRGRAETWVLRALTVVLGGLLLLLLDAVLGGAAPARASDAVVADAVSSGAAARDLVAAPGPGDEPGRGGERSTAAQAEQAGHREVSGDAGRPDDVSVVLALPPVADGTSAAEPPAPLPEPAGPVEPTPVEPVEPTPVEPAPLDPVEPAPVEPAPVEPAPVEPAPVEPVPVEPVPVEPVPVEPVPVEPVPVEPVPVEPVPVEPVPGEPVPVEPAPVEPVPVDAAAPTTDVTTTPGVVAELPRSVANGLTGDVLVGADAASGPEAPGAVPAVDATLRGPAAREHGPSLPSRTHEGAAPSAPVVPPPATLDATRAAGVPATATPPVERRPWSPSPGPVGPQPEAPAVVTAAAHASAGHGADAALAVPPTAASQRPSVPVTVSHDTGVGTPGAGSVTPRAGPHAAPAHSLRPVDLVLVASPTASHGARSTALTRDVLPIPA